jgi:hypothetical protein
MPQLNDIVKTGRKVAAHRPWPRVVVNKDAWHAAIERLVEGRLTLLGLWGDKKAVHMALLEDYPSVGKWHAPAIRLERTIRDLWGLNPVGLPDTRPWLDHGKWGMRHPLGSHRRSEAVAPAYAFLPTEGEGLHQIPVGPVHAGIIEPGHFRFTANGEAVVRLEERLGYVHKGIESLMAGASIEQGAKLAGRTSGDSTVAYAFAFARAVEAALGIEAPPRAA